MKSATRLFVTDPYALCAPHLGTSFKARIFGVRTLIVTDPALAHTVLVDFADKLSGRVGNRVVAEALFGNSLLYQDGEEHIRLRRALRPLFVGPPDVERADEILREFAREASVSAKEVRTLDFFRAVIVATTLSLFMNARASFIEALELSALVDDLGTGLYASSLTEGSRSRFGRALAAKNEIIEFIEGQRSALKTSNLGSVGLSNGDLLDQALTFLFAGVDTISATLTWAFDNLIQRHTKGISNLSESEAFTDALASYPPVYFIPRGAVATVDIGGVTVNRGWNVNVMISELHKRFMQTGDQASFMPFGIGPKRCPAQSYSHIIGARLLQTFLKEFCVEVEPWDTKALRFVPGLRPAASPRLAIAKASI